MRELMIAIINNIKELLIMFFKDFIIKIKSAKRD